MTPAAPVVSTIVKRVPRTDASHENARERKLGGRYRVIHGQVAVPRPEAEYLRPDGSEDPHKLKIEYAIEGDVVNLSDDDAARMLDADIVEPLDAKPSRVGKVCEPPRSTVTNKNTGRAAR
jgi:hypothetical protein